MSKTPTKTQDKTPKKRGRPFVELTPQQISEVERMAAYLNKAQIAACLGIGENTFIRLTKENESIDAAYKRGRASHVGKVADALLKNATEKNNVLAQMFFLKCRGGWVESQPEQERQTINISYSPATGRQERDVTPKPERLDSDGNE